MSVILRSLSIVLIAVAGLATLRSGNGALASSSPDGRILSHASLLLAKNQRAQVIAWLRARAEVQAVTLGRDGVSITVGFKDGREGVILPDAVRTVRLGPAAQPRVEPLVEPRQGTARAAVWEPFATELGLGPHAGDPEVGSLQSAGFQVSQAYDEQVTVDLMASMSSYNVVYDHAHSGFIGSTAAVATGQIDNGDPSMAPLIQSGQVIGSGMCHVAGTSTPYYCITTLFVQNRVSPFPRNALLFLNGCALLRTSSFWQALAAKGAGVLVSWDEDAQAGDDYIAGAAFFNLMQQGATTQSAISQILAAGFGKSSYNGVPAKLGFMGDGSITLQLAGQGQVPPATATPFPTSPPPPTSTPRPVPSATPIVFPTALPTSAPLPTALPSATPVIVPTSLPTVIPRVSLDAILKALVAPGDSQTINVQTAPNTTVKLHVAFPNGDVLDGQQTSDASGQTAFSYTQKHNQITRFGDVATVTLQAGDGATAVQLLKQYTIKAGKIDATVQPRQQSPGKLVSVWVHTRARVEVRVSLRSRAKTTKLHARTGGEGWTHLSYRVPGKAQPGQTIKVHVQARAGGKTLQTTTSLVVS